MAEINKYARMLQIYRLINSPTPLSEENKDEIMAFIMDLNDRKNEAGKKAEDAINAFQKVRELEKELTTQKETAKTFSLFTALGATRATIEIKSSQICGGTPDLPNYFELWISRITKPVTPKKEKTFKKQETSIKENTPISENNMEKTESEECKETETESEKSKQSEGEPGPLPVVNKVAEKLLLKVETHYKDLAKLSQEKQAISLKKYYKIWLFGVLCSRHNIAKSLRQRLHEPANPEDEEAMNKYWGEVETFCSDVEVIFNNTSDGIHNPSRQPETEEIVEILGKQNLSDYTTTLKILMEIV